MAVGQSYRAVAGIDDRELEHRLDPSAGPVALNDHTGERAFLDPGSKRWVIPSVPIVQQGLRRETKVCEDLGDGSEHGVCQVGGSVCSGDQVGGCSRWHRGISSRV